ncbi:MAG: toll/interleukin-1 receptor domain-containing protein [Chitinophagaceae bacterium]|nr:toll/interleukin-1 receptor domain-containing protein [Chitinophagaceae bacterium]
MKWFFSYSRNDGSFVERLATDLKHADVDIWLDKQDIPPGHLWDQEIQKALTEASGIVVVLSRQSVSSNNVMDEVSWALKKGKRVIPVLLEECDAPFRLQRLQYVDFTSDYDAALAQLLLSLRQSKENHYTTTTLSATNDVTPAKKKKGCSVTFAITLLSPVYYEELS